MSSALTWRWTRSLLSETDMPRPTEIKRPDPDALLQLAAREGRGKLTVFLGAAPGVGKTYEMLPQ